MQRADLAPAILQLKALGIDNVLRFNFPSSPPSKNLLAGLELLYALGAINNCGELTTPLGMTMAEMPLEPVLAKCLIVSGIYFSSSIEISSPLRKAIEWIVGPFVQEFSFVINACLLIVGEMGCSDEISTILAMLQVQNVYVRPGGGQAAMKARVAHRMFEVAEGDLLTLLNIYSAFEKNKTPAWCQKHFLNHKALKRATEIRSQMRGLMKKLEIPILSAKSKNFSIFLSYFLDFSSIFTKFNEFDSSRS